MTAPVRRFVVVAALAACVAAADATRGFTVAVLRRDGILIPFATFDGKRWSNNWPPPQLDLTVPINVASIPSRWWGRPGLRADWQAWVAGAPRSLRVVQPDWVNVHCSRNIGLRSDYHANDATPPASMQPFPKDGIAVSPAQPIDAIEIIPPGDPSVRKLEPTILEAFNRSEREAESRWGHPITRRSREGIAPILEAVYAYGGSPRVYYVEAARTYRMLGTPTGDCDAIGIGAGWFRHEGGDVRSLLMTVDVLSCDRRGASYMMPLGALRIGERTFWFAQFSGWDHERYVVIELTRTKAEALVSTWAGGC